MVSLGFGTHLNAGTAIQTITLVNFLVAFNDFFIYLPLDSDVWWHYMLEMAFYWSLFFTQFSDVKRKVIHSNEVISLVSKIIF